MDDVVGEKAVQYGTSWPHLKRAPVIEALIDIAVEPREGVDETHIEAFFPAESLGFYLKGKLVEGMLSFGVTLEGPSVTPSRDVRVVGRRYHSRDEKYVLQLRADRFVLSRLAPYESWDRLASEARRLWTTYVEAFAPHRTVRLAVRYINTLLTTGSSPWNAHLRKTGELPEGIPQTVESHFQRTQILDSSRDARVVVSTVVEPGAGGYVTTLDIDTFAEADLDCSDIRTWKRLDDLRDLKNVVFFNSLTDKTIEDLK